MKKPQRILLALVAALGSHFTLFAQNAPVPFEAESGTSTAPIAGATIGDWLIGTTTASGTVSAATYATTRTDQAAYSGGNVAPATAARVLTYNVTFPGAGVYDLYARVWVGPGGFSDDSYYYGNGFGAKSPTTSTDWQLINGLAAGGYTSGSSSIVDGGGAGGYSTNTTTPLWKWVNMSKFAGGTTFTVPAGSLTQTFQIGGREDGLYFDKFVFGDHSLYFTVANLDNGVQGTTTPPVVYVPTGTPLATGKPKYLGCAYSSPQAPYFGVYWNAVTPENGGKWGSVESTRGTYNWTDLDAAYAQATSTGSVFRMHNLIWGAQQPTWLYNLSDADQLAAINAWYAAVAARYPKIDFIDVVNEPLRTPPTGFVTIGSASNPTGSVATDGGHYINALGGTGVTGYDWIIKSFQLARQYFPKSKLMINEYSVENSTAAATSYTTIINLLKARGLIDGIGIQGHAFSTAGTPAATITACLNIMAATNLPLYITEYDTDGLVDATQLAEYQRVFPLFWEHPAVRGVTLWGYRVGHWRTSQGAYLMNPDNSERAALVWLRTYIANTYTGPMWTGNTSAAWTTGSNWISGSNRPDDATISSATTNTVPAATDDVFFPGYATNQPTVSAAQAIRSVTLGTSSTLTTNAVLTMTGNLTNNGGAVAGTGTVALAGSSAQTIGGTSMTTFPNLTVGAATANLAAPAQVRQMLTLNGNLTTNGQPFTLLSDATGTAMVVNTSGAVVGNATVQRYITPTNAGNGYRHYAPPVAGSTVADLTTSGFTPTVNPAYNTAANPYAVTPFPTVFDYNSTRLTSASAITSAFDFGWESPTALTDALNPGQGYTVNIAGTQLVDFVGTLNNGPISRTNLTRGSQADAGWQLLGNPYPAPIDWNVVSTSGLDAAVYVFRSTGPYAGTYSSYLPSGASTNGGTNQLAAMQGFFVRTTSASTPGSISFANAARLTTYASPIFQRTASTDPLVRLTLTAATGAADEAVVYFPSGATTGFDAAADAYKLVAGGAPVLASDLGTAGLLSINALPALSTAQVAVPLRVDAPLAGSYVLKASELLNLPAGLYAYLRDAQTGALFDLSQPAGYTVNLTAGAATAGRFTLLLSPNQALATAPAAISQQVAIFPNPAHGGTVSLSLPATLGQQVIEAAVLNSLGQTVAHQTLPASPDAVRSLVLPTLAQGIYTVRLQTSAGTVSKRLTIN